MRPFIGLIYFMPSLIHIVRYRGLRLPVRKQSRSSSESGEKLGSRGDGQVGICRRGGVCEREKEKEREIGVRALPLMSMSPFIYVNDMRTLTRKLTRTHIIHSQIENTRVGTNIFCSYSDRVA